MTAMSSGVNAVGFGVGADEAHGAGHVQSALLLGVGPQAVVHYEGLEAQLPQVRRRGQAVGVVAAEHIGPAGQQNYRAARRHALAYGYGRDVGRKS